MTEEKQAPEWLKRFRSNRMAFESVLFEKELFAKEKADLRSGILGAVLIGVISSVLLAVFSLWRGEYVSPADASGFQIALDYLRHFTSGGILKVFQPLWAGIGGISQPPFYYLAYVPVLKYITGNLNLAVFFVNSFYLIALSCAVFLAVVKYRNNQSGWLASLCTMALPFVIDAARHPDYRLASMTLATAVYACYINSEEFEYYRWNFWFGLFFSLGFFTDTRFWVYMLPLLPSLLAALTSPMLGGSLFKGLLPGFALALPWYVFYAIFILARYFTLGIPSKAAESGFWRYFAGVFGSGGLLAVPCLAAIAWMYFSLFRPYSAKKTVAAWFCVPVIVIYLFYGGKTGYLFPALIPFAVALAVMTPGKIRKYMFGFVAFMLLVNTVSQNRVCAVIWPAAPGWAANTAAEILGTLALENTDTTKRVAIIGAETAFGRGNMLYLSQRKYKSKFAFPVYTPQSLGLADYIIFQEGAKGPLAEALNSGWFHESFAGKMSFAPKGSPVITVYAKKPGIAVLHKGRHKLGNIDFIGFSLQDAVISLSDFDAARGVYSKARLEAPYANFADFDIYGLSLEVTGFSVFGTGRMQNFTVTGADKIKIISAKTTNYSFERFLGYRYGWLAHINVNLDETARVSGVKSGKSLQFETVLYSDRKSLVLKLLGCAYGSYELPDPLLGLFGFKYELSELPVVLDFQHIQFRHQLMEIS